MENQQTPQQIPIKISDEVLKGNYSNQTMIRHSPNEFIMDFVNFTLGDPNAVITDRVILSPTHFKSLIAAMQENLGNYEKQFGELKSSETEKHKFGFDTNKAQ